MESWPVLSKKELTEAGLTARQHVGDIAQNCGDVADTLEGILIDDYGLPYQNREAAEKYRRREVRVGLNGEEKHYVFEIDGVFVSGSTGTLIWVDASFDQFNYHNEERGIVDISYGSRAQLDAVRVMPPSDARRKEQYMEIGEFFG